MPYRGALNSDCVSMLTLHLMICIVVIDDLNNVSQNFYDLPNYLFHFSNHFLVALFVF